MNTLRAALVPGIVAGIISIFASWFWMGCVFHSYQRATPETWRPEGPRNYVLSSVVRLLAAIAIAFVYVLIARFHVAIFSEGIIGALRFAIVAWIAFVAPVAVEAALYIRLHSMVVLGQVLDWLTTCILACAVTAFWLGR
jgi:Protein of unknown function (DUF1761)